MEIWKDVIGYEGLYQVSNLGRVKSFWSDKYLDGKILSPSFDSKQKYLFVGLHKDKVVKQVYVHRLVAQTFIPNPYKLPCINHKDENKTNNCVDNLEWCTIKYNSNYGRAKERMIESRKRNPNYQQSIIQGQLTRNKLKCSGAEKKVEQYSLGGEFIKEWKSLTEVEKTCGISRSGITRCCLGIFKQCKGYLWKFKDIDNE